MDKKKSINEHLCLKTFEKIQLKTFYLNKSGQVVEIVHVQVFMQEVRFFCLWM